MVQDTKTRTLDGVLLDNLIAQQLVQSRGRDETVLEPSIDASNFGEVSMPYLMAAKITTKMFKDEELLRLFNNNADPIKTLKALVVADTFLESNLNLEARDLISAAAMEGNAQKILDIVTAQNKGVLSEAQVEEYLARKVPQLIAKATETTELNDYKFEKISGKLGEGVRLSSEKIFFEHAKLNDNYTFRIKKEDNGLFKVIMHAKKIANDNFYEGYKHLLNVTNSVFNGNTKMSLDEFLDDVFKDKEEVYFKSAKIGNRKYVKKNICNISSPVVLFNKEDNYVNKASELGFHEAGMNIDIGFLSVGAIGGIGSLISLGFGIFGHQWGAFPYLLSIAGAGFSPLLSIPFNKNSFFSYLIDQKKEVKERNDFILTSRSIESFANENKAFYEKMKSINDIDQLGIARTSRQEKLNALNNTFEYLKDVKGFSLEFSTETLDDAYLKLHQIVSLIDKK